jgi:hypothetical protein
MDGMEQTEKPLTKEQLAEAKARRLAAAHLQEIESNPLDAGEVAMFEMFEREAWPHERRLAHIGEQARAASTVPAAD